MFLGFCILLITVFSLQLTNEASTKKREEEYIPIKYPGPVQDISTRYGSNDDEVPPECRNQNFCTIKPPDYPQEKFNAIFKGTKAVSQPTLVIETFGDRQGDVDDPDNCQSEVVYEPLYKVRSKRGDWRVVAQAPDENYVQMVRLETCKNVQGACFTAFSLPSDIVTFCDQKYSVWEFLVDAGNGTEKVTAELPICCSCRYKIT